MGDPFPRWAFDIENPVLQALDTVMLCIFHEFETVNMLDIEVRVFNNLA